MAAGTGEIVRTKRVLPGIKDIPIREKTNRTRTLQAAVGPLSRKILHELRVAHAKSHKPMECGTISYSFGW